MLLAATALVWTATPPASQGSSPTGISRVIVATGGGQSHGDARSDGGGTLSADGTRVVFTGSIGMQPEGQPRRVFVRDRATGQTVRLPTPRPEDGQYTYPYSPQISADGNTALYSWWTENRLPNRLFVVDLRAGELAERRLLLPSPDGD